MSVLRRIANLLNSVLKLAGGIQVGDKKGDELKTPTKSKECHFFGIQMFVSHQYI